MSKSCQIVIKKFSQKVVKKLTQNLFDFRKALKDRRRRGNKFKKEGRKQGRRKKNTRASLDQVATSSYLVKKPEHSLFSFCLCTKGRITQRFLPEGVMETFFQKWLF
jgi:hypothetical protein